MAEEYEPLPESLAQRRIRTNHEDQFSLGARPEERRQTVNPNQSPRDLLHEGSQQTRPLMWSPGVGTPPFSCVLPVHTHSYCGPPYWGSTSPTGATCVSWYMVPVTGMEPTRKKKLRPNKLVGARKWKVTHR